MFSPSTEAKEHTTNLPATCNCGAHCLEGETQGPGSQLFWVSSQRSSPQSPFCAFWDAFSSFSMRSLLGKVSGGQRWGGTCESLWPHPLSARAARHYPSKDCFSLCLSQNYSVVRPQSQQWTDCPRCFALFPCPKLYCMMSDCMLSPVISFWTRGHSSPLGSGRSSASGWVPTWVSLQATTLRVMVKLSIWTRSLKQVLASENLSLWSRLPLWVEYGHKALLSFSTRMSHFQCVLVSTLPSSRAGRYDLICPCPGPLVLSFLDVGPPGPPTEFSSQTIILFN